MKTFKEELVSSMKRAFWNYIMLVGIILLFTFVLIGSHFIWTGLSLNY